jgi:hypothetical protein
MGERTYRQPSIHPESQVLSTLALMDKKLDLIWTQDSTIAQASQGSGEGAVRELPPLSLNGGSVKFRFKRIGERYHYEVSLEGSVDAISRLVAPQGKNALLKVTFVDQDHFDLADLTLSGQQFAIQQSEGRKGVRLDKQGEWEGKVDLAAIKDWRLEVLEDSADENLGALPAPRPSAQAQDLAADVTVHPATGKLLLPESLQNLQNTIAQATPSPTPAGATPTFHDPPTSLPKAVPNAAENPKASGVSLEPQGTPKGGAILPVDGKGKN